MHLVGKIRSSCSITIPSSVEIIQTISLEEVDVFDL